jgi:hypothetical protein
MFLMRNAEKTKAWRQNARLSKWAPRTCVKCRCSLEKSRF